MATIGGQANTPDLPTQLESLLDAVWRAERYQRVCDRIDLAVRTDEQRKRDRERKDRHDG